MGVVQSLPMISFLAQLRVPCLHRAEQAQGHLTDMAMMPGMKYSTNRYFLVSIVFLDPSTRVESLVISWLFVSTLFRISIFVERLMKSWGRMAYVMVTFVLQVLKKLSPHEGPFHALGNNEGTRFTLSS